MLYYRNLRNAVLAGNELAGGQIRISAAERKGYENYPVTLADRKLYNDRNKGNDANGVK